MPGKSKLFDRDVPDIPLELVNGARRRREFAHYMQPVPNMAALRLPAFGFC